MYVVFLLTLPLQKPRDVNTMSEEEKIKVYNLRTTVKEPTFVDEPMELGFDHEQQFEYVQLLRQSGKL